MNYTTTIKAGFDLPASIKGSTLSLTVNTQSSWFKRLARSVKQVGSVLMLGSTLLTVGLILGFLA